MFYGLFRQFGFFFQPMSRDRGGGENMQVGRVCVCVFFFWIFLLVFF